MPDATDVYHVIRGKRKAHGLDREIADLAGRQHGVAAAWQLTTLGLPRRGIEGRLQAGRLHVLHRGVYAVGHEAVSPKGRWMAAVLAGGTGALLSHRPAAALWRLCPIGSPTLDVTVARQRRPKRSVRFHHSVVPLDERTTVDGIPVTTMPRTLLDLATVVDRRQLERAINEADVLGLSDPLSLPDLLSRYPRRAGTRVVRAALESRSAGATITRSELEERFLHLLDRHGLPRPGVNAQVEVAGGVVEVDCVWLEQRLVVELDGHAVHGTRAAFERDRERDRALQVAGWRVVRVTWRQWKDTPRKVTTDLRRLLAT